MIRVYRRESFITWFLASGLSGSWTSADNAVISPNHHKTFESGTHTRVSTFLKWWIQYTSGENKVPRIAFFFIKSQNVPESQGRQQIRSNLTCSSAPFGEWSFLLNHHHPRNYHWHLRGFCWNVAKCNFGVRCLVSEVTTCKTRNWASTMSVAEVTTVWGKCSAAVDATSRWLSQFSSSSSSFDHFNADIHESISYIRILFKTAARSCTSRCRSFLDFLCMYSNIGAYPTCYIALTNFTCSTVFRGICENHGCRRNSSAHSRSLGSFMKHFIMKSFNAYWCCFCNEKCIKNWLVRYSLATYHLVQYETMLP